MERIGTVREIWRYPVKSMGGESLSHCNAGVKGISGDRGWALRDEVAGEVRGAKKLPQLLLCQARYLAEPVGDDVPPAELTLPDGARLRSDDSATSARLSELLGRPVTICSRRPASDRDHYRRAAPDDPDFFAEMRQIFGRLDDEPLPDLTVFPPEILEFTSPLGTYFDAFPVHVLTTATIEALGGAPKFDRRRFRPNFFIETDGAARGLVETEWCGRTIRIGGLRLAIQMPTVRCVMTTLPQPDLAKDPSVLRTIVRDAGQNVGVYATVVDGGAVAVGDALEVE